MANSAEGGAVYQLLLKRMNRRDVLVGGSLLAAAGAVGCSDQTPPASGTGLAAGSATAGAATPGPAAARATAFATIPGSAEDRVIVPEGFTSEVIVRWGDPLVAGSSGMPLAGLADGSLLAPGAGAARPSSWRRIRTWSPSCRPAWASVCSSSSVTVTAGA